MDHSTNKKEIEKFAKLSYDWWNFNGKFSALHRINPLRIKFILDIVYKHYNINAFHKNPLSDLKILDIGCGGGLACEPIAKLGGLVHGIDADKEAIKILLTEVNKNNEEIPVKDIKVKSSEGECEVVVYSSKHLDTMAQMSLEKIELFKR